MRRARETADRTAGSSSTTRTRVVTRPIVANGTKSAISPARDHLGWDDVHDLVRSRRAGARVPGRRRARRLRPRGAPARRADDPLVRAVARLRATARVAGGAARRRRVADLPDQRLAPGVRLPGPTAGAGKTRPRGAADLR